MDIFIWITKHGQVYLFTLLERYLWYLQTQRLFSTYSQCRVLVGCKRFRPPLVCASLNLWVSLELSWTSGSCSSLPSLHDAHRRHATSSTTGNFHKVYFSPRKWLVAGFLDYWSFGPFSFLKLKGIHFIRAHTGNIMLMSQCNIVNQIWLCCDVMDSKLFPILSLHIGRCWNCCQGNWDDITCFVAMDWHCIVCPVLYSKTFELSQPWLHIFLHY